MRSKYHPDIYYNEHMWKEVGMDPESPYHEITFLHRPSHLWLRIYITSRTKQIISAHLHWDVGGVVSASGECDCDMQDIVTISIPEALRILTEWRLDGKGEACPAWDHIEVDTPV